MVLGAVLLLSHPVTLLGAEDTTGAQEAATSSSSSGEEPQVTGTEQPGTVGSELPEGTGGDAGSEQHGTSEGTEQETPAVPEGEDVAGPTEIPVVEPGQEETASEEAADPEGPAAADATSQEEEQVVPKLGITVTGSGTVTLSWTDGEEALQKQEFAGGREYDPMQIKAGTRIAAEVKAKEGCVFSGWKTVPEDLEIKDGEFVMPSEDLLIEAVFKTAGEGESLSADGASEEAQEENKDKPEKTNEELISEQNIEALPVPERDFRFWHVDRDIAFAANSARIREDIQKDAKVVGKLKKGGAVFILEKVDLEWYYVESGQVRGFMHKDDVTDEDREKELLRFYALKAQKLAAEKMQAQTITDLFTMAEATVEPADNKAYLYRKCTSGPVVVEKEFALAKEDGAVILERPYEGARVCGRMSGGSLAYILTELETVRPLTAEPVAPAEGDAEANTAEAEENSGHGDDSGDPEVNGMQQWYYVESGDVRGFVSRSSLMTGDDVDSRIEEAGGDAVFAVSSQEIAPEDNEATYYTFTSIKEGIPLNPVRDALIKSAEQCLGHPYVWGGTSLLEGCDCSGFVQSLYAMYGYSIPRVAEDQSMFGRQIPIENAQPGDLIFFARDGYVYHVALYVGDDQTIEAYGTAVGIIRNGVDHVNGVWATRVIDD